MPEELGALYYWGTQGNNFFSSFFLASLEVVFSNANVFFAKITAPVRFMFSMGLVFYSYTFGPTGPLGAYTTGTSRKPGFFGGSGGGSATDGLKNRVIFTFLFIEMVAWFWLWVTLREERGGVVERMRKQQERNAR